MQRRLFLISLLSLGAGRAALFAHDAKKHKGKARRGEVTAVDAEGFELRTSEGTRRIGVTAKTKFEHGDQEVAFDQLVKGGPVTVFGTILGNGKEMAAKEIILEEAGHDLSSHKH